MKNNRMYVDIGSMLDEIFETAKTFGEEMKNNFGDGMKGPFGPGKGPFGPGKGPWGSWEQDDNADWYPGYSYPPMNIYLTAERAQVFEVALAGFAENDISLTFQGDYMVFSATMVHESIDENDIRYIKRRLKLKDIEKQKYYVPADKFNQEGVKAVFKNGILKVTIPPKDAPQTPEGIKIEIIKDGV